MEDKTLTLNIVSRALPSRFGEQASEACNAMATGVEELQGAGKKAQWREVTPADKNKVKRWQEESLAQGDVGDMAAARKAGSSRLVTEASYS